MRKNTKWRAHWLACILPLVLALACMPADGTRDSKEDAAAAQQYLYHDIPGYSELDTLDALFAIDQFIAAANLISGNFLMAGLIERVGTLGMCYQEAGALAARTYSVVSEGKYGLLLVVNQDRVIRNFLSCVTRGPAIAQVGGGNCLKIGSFRANEDNYLYVYAGTHADLCDTLAEHFAALSG